MVSIKKNNKGEPQVVTGVRSQASSIYTPGQNPTFKGRLDIKLKIFYH